LLPTRAQSRRMIALAAFLAALVFGIALIVSGIFNPTE
jgi:hypothetical protein